MIMTSCPSAEQVSILLSSASILATEITRKISTSSVESVAASSRKTSTVEKKVSFDSPAITEALEVEPEMAVEAVKEGEVPEAPEVVPVENKVEPPTV